MTEITRPHPRLPFLTLCIARPTAEELAAIAEWEAKHNEYSGGGDVKAYVMNGEWEVGYSSGVRHDESDEEIFARLAHDSEHDFFTERDGAYLHLREKARQAAAAGDLELLCLLAEGFGYWRGATEAHRRASEYHKRSLDPAAAPDAPPKPLSFFDELGDPPTILADYHERERQRAKLLPALDCDGGDVPF